MLQSDSVTAVPVALVDTAASTDASPTLARLICVYGEAMTVAEVAQELQFSATYVAKKIGAVGYEHLPWVKAIAPRRRKRGRRWVYATEAVVKYLDTSQ